MQWIFFFSRLKRFAVAEDAGLSESMQFKNKTRIGNAKVQVEYNYKMCFLRTIFVYVFGTLRIAITIMNVLF
jgi:hypothetical protein